jgi:hypothetical protein
MGWSKDHPFLRIELNTGIFNHMPSISDQEALAMWDAILNSFKLRSVDPQTGMADAGGSPPPKDEQKLNITVTEILFDAKTIKVARVGKSVSTPHWSKAEKAQLIEEDKQTLQHYDTGSKRPAAFLFLQETNKTEVRRFDVKIDIDSENPPAPDFALVAEFPNGLRAESTSINIPAKTKKSLTIGMKFVQETLPKSLSHIEGNVTWEARLNAKLDGKTKRITGDTYSVTNADEPKVELFFLYDKPMSFYKSGVWAEALRLCFKKAGVAGLTDPKDISAKITEYCHSKDGHGMIYDVYRGRPCFGVDYTGGTFNLKEYIEKKNVSVIHSDFPVPANTVNCFDSGAAVQTLSGAFGVKTQWIYQWPFGFMAKTNLVGIGECNNPFFIRNGTNKVVDPMDKKRTSFSCHVFVSAKPSTEDIRDACAGPHIGEETLRQYLESAIDKEPMADDWVSLHVKLGASAEEKMKARASFLKDSYNDAEKAALFYTGVVNVKW